MPFEVPNGWCWCKICNVCLIESGYAFPSESFKKSGLPLIRISNIKDGVVDLDNCVYLQDVESERFIVNEGDLLLAMSGATTGKMGVYKYSTQALLNQRVCKIKSNPVLLTNGYRDCYMMSQSEHILKLAYGGAQPNISANVIADFNIPIPSLAEQKRIVAEVEKWMAIIDEIESSKTDLQQLITQVKSKILDLAIRGKLVEQDKNDEPACELLKRINPDWQPSDTSHYEQLPKGWEFARLADLCTFLSRGKSPKYSDERLYPVFAQKCNLKDGGISLDKAQFLDPETLVKWPADYKLRTGDILINSTGTGTVGRTRLFDESVLGHYPFVVPDSHVSVVRTFDTISSEYIFAVISSIRYQKYIEDNLAGSTNQKELYIGVLEDMVIPLPPLPEQERITAKIKSLFNTLDSISQSLTD